MKLTSDDFLDTMNSLINEAKTITNDEAKIGACYMIQHISWILESEIIKKGEENVEKKI